MADYDYDDYGYGGEGDAPAADYDYGYGDSDDLGYGNTDDVYGYGETEPDMGYGEQEDVVTEEIAPKRKTPKRRCSVTKYSLVSAAENGGAEAEMVKNLNAAEMLNAFRNGGGAPEAAPSEASTDSKSVDTLGTLPQSEDASAPVKVSKFSRLRKRLSIFG